MKDLNTLQDAIAFLSQFTTKAEAIGDIDMAYRNAYLSEPGKLVSDVHKVSLALLNKAYELIAEQSAFDDVELLELFASNVNADAYIRPFWLWRVDINHVRRLPSGRTIPQLIKENYNVISEMKSDVWVYECAKTYYIANPKIKLRMSDCCVRILLLEDAMKRGKKCIEYSIYSTGDRLTFHEKLKRFIVESVGGFDFEKQIIPFLDGLFFQRSEYGYESMEIGDLEVQKYERSSAKVFSPFELHTLKPLQEIPKKWTVQHFARAIANGQFIDLQRDFKYTDDYSADSAYNWYKGAIANPLSVVQEVIECSAKSFSLWESHRTDEYIEISFGRHSNDGRSVKVVLDNRFSKVDLSSEIALIESISAVHQYEVESETGDLQKIESCFPCEYREVLLDGIWSKLNKKRKGDLNGDLVMLPVCIDDYDQEKAVPFAFLPDCDIQNYATFR